METDVYIDMLGHRRIDVRMNVEQQATFMEALREGNEEFMQINYDSSTLVWIQRSYIVAIQFFEVEETEKVKRKVPPEKSRSR